MMDNPISVRPREPARRAGAARAVKTELSASQSVTAAQTVVAPHAPSPAQDNTSREAAIDEQSYAVINRSKDESEPHEDRAPSDEALMRLRAYAKTDRKPEETETHADLEV